MPHVMAADLLSKETLAQQLGWVVDAANPNCCYGYFEDSFKGKKMKGALDKVPITIKADQGTFRQQGRTTLQGHVVISQSGREITATTAHLDRDKSASSDQESIDLQGDVVLREPGSLIMGRTGHVDLKTKFIEMKDAYYRISFGQKLGSVQSQDTVAWGGAGSLARQTDGVVSLKKATYTTCSPINPTWKLRANKIELNQETGRGMAKGVVLDVKNVPVFYLPVFNFPIDKRRQTGFLFPSIGTSNRQGLSFLLPFYWNIAPNYDDTITPAIYGHRGIQLNNDFRYLTKSSRGDFYLSFLPNDSVFESFKQSAPQLYANSPSSASLPDLENASNNRFAVSWQHNTQFNEHWLANIHYSYVNDDYYLQDFAGLPGVVTPNQLLREGEVLYQGDIWNFKALAQNYLTLHPVNETPTQNQYSRMPEFDLTGSFPAKNAALNFQWDSQFVNFLQQTEPGATLPPPEGDRLNLQPSLNFPVTTIWGYWVPSLQYQFTQYIIDGQVPAEGTIFTPHTINRSLPIFNMDSGLYFEKTSVFRDETYKQTLEPRLFYLFVPYKNQNDIPEFDTSLQPFGYNQLFLTNRFSGIDRVGDANQVSVGVTTRLLNMESSREIASFSLGEILYFENRKVTYCTTPDCQDINDSPGATPASTIVSPIAGQATLGLSRLWSLNGTLAWDPTLGKTNNAGVSLGYRAPGNRVFNIGYNFLTLGDLVQTNPPTSTSSAINNLNQAAVSLSWPIQDRWRIFSGITYNISHVHAQNYLYGLEYDSCCWAMRVVGGRVFQSLNQNNNPVFNNAIFLQLQLKGLGNFGSTDPTNFLMSNIPGYNDNFGKTT